MKLFQDSPLGSTRHPNLGFEMADSSGWMKHAGLGIELAGTTIGVAALGYAIDWKLQNETQYATALFALIGFSFAMFRFIQNVTRENH